MKNEKEKIKRIKELVTSLNKHRDAYYNKQQPTISDKEYDDLFDELQLLEKETGIIMSNSPTTTVGYEVKSELKKVEHSHPMLSLDKTKSVDDLEKFAKDKNCLLSLKMDGLTVLLTYDNGVLIQAETRGNGETGELITHNAKVFENIPLHIEYKGRLEIEGEAIITYDDFEKINETITNPDDKYKNPRNLASGSVRQLDSSIASKRHIKFIAWKVPKIKDGKDSFNHYNSHLFRLNFVKYLGFDIVPLLTYINSSDRENLEKMIDALKRTASINGYPIDGLVITYDDIEYGESLGKTGHHPKHSLAFKFYDEVVETKVINIEWTMGKTGVLTPTAIFEPVEIDGTTVERASVHNVSILTDLELCVGDTIEVYKANQIIPQVKRNISSEKRWEETKSGGRYIQIPATCPICGGNTELIRENSSIILKCTNNNCKGKLLGKLTHFVSKNAMNIDGLSEATLEKFINLGLINSFKDIFTLKDHFTELVKLDGFGETSVNKLLKAIEESKNTTLDRFIYALCIPLIGRSASKTISKYFDNDYKKFDEAWDLAFGFDWTKLEDFGSNMNTSMVKYYLDNFKMISELATYMNFEKPQTVQSNVNLDGKTFVITGSLNTFENRDAAKDMIESLGGKVSGSVSKKTSYLVNNDITSTSGKNKKAKELGVPIITEDELIKMLK